MACVGFVLPKNLKDKKYSPNLRSSGLLVPSFLWLVTQLVYRQVGMFAFFFNIKNIFCFVCFSNNAMQIGNVFNFSAFTFAPQSLTSAMGSLQFVSNVFFGKVSLRFVSNMFFWKGKKLNPDGPMHQHILANTYYRGRIDRFCWESMSRGKSSLPHWL